MVFKYQKLKSKRSALVAAFAVGKIWRPERTHVIVTRGATLSSRRWEMHRCHGSRNLLAAAARGAHGVTRTAAHRSRVFRMLEIDSVRLGPIRGPRRASRLVTHVAGTNVPAADLPVRRVALETSGMSGQPCRDRQRRAGSSRAMTRRTIGLAVMPCVAEARTEASQRREAFQGRRTGSGVAYRADRTVAVSELLLMTARARRMANGTLRGRGIVVAAVTQQARHSSVLRIAVSESRVVLFRCRWFRRYRRIRRFFDAFGNGAPPYRKTEEQTRRDDHDQFDRPAGTEQALLLRAHLHFAAASAFRCESGIGFVPNTI